MRPCWPHNPCAILNTCALSEGSIHLEMSAETGWDSGALRGHSCVSLCGTAQGAEWYPGEAEVELTGMFLAQMTGLYDSDGTISSF